ncbi:hypothetical protein SBA4_2130006 [Candidatus Sulfopaludibacter sp. SbA4]|nr:hypothetical protein SBA4_2130006 [Candidatus Sulfopaludibacter sp. SbA4]
MLRISDDAKGNVLMERRMKTPDSKICGFCDRHIFSKPGVAGILNLQPRGSLAKPCQLKQVRAVILRYKLADGAE